MSMGATGSLYGDCRHSNMVRLDQRTIYPLYTSNKACIDYHISYSGAPRNAVDRCCSSDLHHCFLLASLTSQRSRCLQIFLVSALAATALFGWQKLYFDSWMPLPVIAKQSGNFLEKIQAGNFYLLMNSGLNPILPFALFAIPVIWWQQRKRRIRDKIKPEDSLALAAIFIIVYTGFVWAAGGDWMQAGRFLVQYSLLPPSC